MNYLDIILAIPLLWAAYKGFSKGLVVEIASLIAIVLGVLGAIHFSFYVSNALKLTSSYSPLICFAITFLIIVISIHFLARLIEGTLKLAALGLVNKLLGAIFGMIKIAFVLSVIMIFFEKINAPNGLIPEKTRKASTLYPAISPIAPFLIPKLHFDDIKAMTEKKSEENVEGTK
jgi:membrane protein required for colicin V production